MRIGHLMYSCIFVGAYAAAAPAPPPAVTPDTNVLLWPGPDFIPIAIKDGPHAGKGYLDQVMATMFPLLPGYQHRIVYGNTARQEHEMKRAGYVCSAALFRTAAREQFMVFSRPYMRILPNGIITLKSMVPRFHAYRGPSGQISLANVVADRSLKLGVPPVRVFGSAIDAVLGPLMKPGLAKHVIMFSGSNIGEGLYDMLQRGRIDYQLGFAIEERYFSSRTPGQKATVFLPLEEAATLLDANFGCTRTPWGQSMVEQLNRLLESRELQQKLRHSYESWLAPDSLKLYRRWLGVQERAQP